MSYPSAGPYPVVTQTNTKAVVALGMGIAAISICPGLLGIVAVVLGGMARREIEASAGMQDGESFAKAGAILGWISIALVAVMIAFLAVLMVVAAFTDS